MVGSSAPPMSMSYDRGLPRVAGCRLLPRTSHCASCTASATWLPARAAPSAPRKSPGRPAYRNSALCLQATNGLDALLAGPFARRQQGNRTALTARLHQAPIEFGQAAPEKVLQTAAPQALRLSLGVHGTVGRSPVRDAIPSGRQERGVQ